MSNTADKAPSGFATKALVQPIGSDSYLGHNLPIYATSSFKFKDPEQGQRALYGPRGVNGYGYSRYGSPNTAEVEQKIAALETHGI
jgi:methionine-gamma-lyase